MANKDAHSGFLVGDTVKVNAAWVKTKKADAKYNGTTFDPKPFMGAWVVTGHGQATCVYLKRPDGPTVLSVYSFGLDLVTAANYTPPTTGTLRPGMHVEILGGANAPFSAGQYGEVTAVDSSGTVYVRQDGVADAKVISGRHLKVIDQRCEDDYIEEVRSKTRRNHEHKWEFSWNDACRTCTKCGFSQWTFECWTHYDWRWKTPRGVLIERTDLDPKKYFGCENFIRPKPPPRPAFRTRSLDIISDEALRVPITVIGAGGIGSFLVLALAKMGFNRVVVYDHDRIAHENTGTQLYGAAVVTGTKTQYLHSLVGSMCPTDTRGNTLNPVQGIARRWDGGNAVGIVVMAVDSMETRKDIWNRIKGNSPRNVQMVIDGRMGAEFAQMYVRNPNDPIDVQDYERTLYTDESAVQEPCTARATVYTGFLIAGMMAKAIKDVVMNNPEYPRTMLWDIARNDQEIFVRPMELRATAS